MVTTAASEAGETVFNLQSFQTGKSIVFQVFVQPHLRQWVRSDCARENTFHDKLFTDFAIRENTWMQYIFFFLYVSYQSFQYQSLSITLISISIIQLSMHSGGSEIYIYGKPKFSSWWRHVSIKPVIKLGIEGFLKGLLSTLNEQAQSLGWVVKVICVQQEAHTFVAKFSAAFSPFPRCFWTPPFMDTTKDETRRKRTVLIWNNSTNTHRFKKILEGGDY